MSEKLSHVSHENHAHDRSESVAAETLEITSHEQLQGDNREKTRDVETALDGALTHAQTKNEKTFGNRDKSPAEKRPRAPSKSHREHAFKATMKDVQSEMDPTSRITSKLLHNPVVEKTSDAVGGSIFRPNAMLSGSIFAFICVTALYFIAKNYGYQLSGLETLAAFAIGWIAGIMYDIFRHLMRRRS